MSSTEEYPAMLTVDEVSAMFRIRKPQIYALARTGVLPSVRVGRAVRFNSAAVQKWLDQGGATADAQPPTPKPERPRTPRQHFEFEAKNADRVDLALRVMDAVHASDGLKDELRSPLTERERGVLFRRVLGQSLESIGLRYGVGRERIRQIDNKARRKLKYACTKLGTEYPLTPEEA